MTDADVRTIRLLEELGANALGAHTVQLLDGWVLRRTPEAPFRRCNSVLPIHGTASNVIDRLEVVADFYRERGLPARFQMSEAARPAGLDGLLGECRYDIEEPVVVMVARTEEVAARSGDPPTPARSDDEGTTVADGIDDGWIEQYSESHGRDDARRRLAAYGRLLTKIGPVVGAAVARAGDVPLGIGLGVLERGWVGVYGMSTRPEVRRRGAATAVLRALAEWARARDGVRMYLQVEETNTVALELYERAGFRPAYRYWYRTLG
jgi:ribosomal protein S18 acetylase RimI-like enzyme